MIVYNNKSFAKNSDYPCTDWIGDADWVLDDNDEKDSKIEEKIISLYPDFEFLLDEGGNISDIIPTEPAPQPPQPPSNAELAAAIAELAEVMCSG